MDKGLFDELSKKVGIKIVPKSEVYLKAVLDYLLLELIKSSEEFSSNKNEGKIYDETILEAIYHDNDFYSMLRKVSINNLSYRIQ